MRILLIHQHFLTKNGSGGSRFNEMTRVWADMGNEITVISGMIYHNSGKKYPEFVGKLFCKEKYSQNVEVIRCHDSNESQKNFLTRLWVYFSFVITGTYAALFLTKKKYDIVIASSPPLTIGIISCVYKFFKKTPYVFEIRDLWPESAIDTGVLNNNFLIKCAFLLEKKFYNDALLINVLTPAFREKLIEGKKISENKIIYIPNAADFLISEEVVSNFDYEKNRKKLNWLDKIVCIYVGAHGVANHLMQIVEVAEKLQDYPFHFVLIGDGMQKKILMEECLRRNLGNVEFIDPVSKRLVFNYILSADIGLSVLKKVDTFKTVFSNKTFDYMACKKPVMMLIDGVSRQLVETAKCGFYVEPENIDQFKEKLIVFSKLTQSQKQELGNNGYEYAKANFSREEIAKKYLNKISNYLNG